MRRKHRLWQSSLKFLWLMLCIFLLSTSIAYADNKWVNRGNSWTAVNIGLTDMGVWSLAIDPLNPATIYAGTDEGLFKGVFEMDFE